MNYQFTELGEHADEYVSPVREYLNFLVKGYKGKPHCPFAKTMLTKRLFFYDVSKSILSHEEFCSALREMVVFIRKMNDRFTVVGVVYANTLNFTLEVAHQVEKYRQIHRLDLISSGLTMAWTHPENEIGTHTNKEKPDYPLWVSKVPMLMVRYLDKGDEPFMLTSEAKEAFNEGMLYLNSPKKLNTFVKDLWD